MKNKNIIPFSKLKGFFVENNIKQQEVADLLGISRSTFNLKLNGKGMDFTCTEVRKMCQKYNLNADIFFLER